MSGAFPQFHPDFRRNRQQSSSLNPSILVPDLWQQDAIRLLLAGRDVVIDAPTGSGKTFVFEQLVENGSIGKAIYTVPTRALANDKLLEWRERGWNVGIATGDLSQNLEAPTIVATLETQRQALLNGEGPDLLVIDEYQMLNDPLRGLHYEMAIACAPPETQLLLLSGSTANPDLIVQWLQRLSRKAELVRCRDRPVPLEEVHLDALRQKVPPGVRGYWPRRIAKALAAGLGPVLIFAPQRQSAEEIAMRLAAALPASEPLELTAEQSKLARGPIRKLLRRRVALHHSGLDYSLRAGLIEPLAKAGQMKVVVATTGLAAGINFSMRSVLVTETHYRFGDEVRRIRSDELLQMFGRAGRRGIDSVGYVLTGADKPRLRDGRSIDLSPNRRIDWQACLSNLQLSATLGTNSRSDLEQLNQRFLSSGRLNLGLRDPLPARDPQVTTSRMPVATKQREMLTPDGTWERLGKKRRIPLSEAKFFDGKKWGDALRSSTVLKTLQVGSLCRLPHPNSHEFGRIVVLAHFPKEANENTVRLTKSFRRLLIEEWKQNADFPKPRWNCSLDWLEKRILPLLPRVSGGGTVLRWEEQNDQIRAYLDYSNAEAFCRIDSLGRALINPPLRERDHFDEHDLRIALGGGADDKPRRPARNWFDLGLVDRFLKPTRRGVVFSFFAQGEGLAIAAGLEENSLEVEELVFQLANLRAGHRFADLHEADGRLGDISRLRYGWRSIPGYLTRGVPTEYGEGAAEIVAAVILDARKPTDFETDHVRSGDVQRAVLEWRSVLRQIVGSPDFAWDRWLALQEEARRHLVASSSAVDLDSLPPLTLHQRQRIAFG
ncbi:MAG: DEAD/DEAH box helicase [Verrucomicrobiota bacterium]